MTDKPASYYLQKLDCNCNDCLHMVRDGERFKQSLAWHEGLQLDYFTIQKNKVLEKARWWDEQSEPNKAENLRREANKMKFQFNKGDVLINYGNCAKLNKAVTFIPNILQMHTQDCFEHRKG